MMPLRSDFSLSTRTTLTFDKSLDFLRRTLPQRGFRIITEVPFHREFEQHVGLRWPNYSVLLVWSPFVAYQALIGDHDAGLYMPFHIIVADSGESTAIAATNPLLFGRMVGTLGSQVLARLLARQIREIFAGLATGEKPLQAESLQECMKEVS